jgi:hypothetical protein
MVLPVAFPLAPFLMRAGITALGAGAAGEGIKSLQNINPDVAEQAFLRTIIGPISDIFNRTTDTPSGKVFAPTGEVIEQNQIPGIAPPEQQQGITGLPIPEKVPGLPGLINPEQVDTSILNKEETTEQPVKPEETKNQIKTWETMGNFKNIEEAKQRSEKAKIPFDEVESSGIKQQITFKKDSEGYGVYFDKKLIGRMDDITQGLKDDNPEVYKGNQKIFNLSFLDSRGYTDAALDTVDTIAEAQYVMKRILAEELLNKESLTRRNFENQKYDKKGNPLIDEKYEMSATDKKISSLIKENNSKSAGSLIDQNLFNENALAKQDDQAYQVNMTPDQYLSLTRKIESGDLENTKERTQRIKDEIKKGGKIENYPYLYIKKEGDNFLVTGEEGRHRALVLKELGVKQMPVMIRGIGSAKDGIENKRYTTPATGYAATDPYLKKFAGYKPKLIISDKTAEKPFQISWENLTTELEPTEKNTSKSAGSLIDKPLSDE